MTIGTKPASFFNVTPIIGVDVSDTYPVYAVPGSSASASNMYNETNNPPFALGTRINGTNNSEFLFCVVGSAGSINANDLVAIDTNFNVLQASSAIGLATGSAGSYQPGFNQGPGLAASAPSTTSNFCWIATRGTGLQVNIAAVGSASVAVTALSGNTFYIGTAPGTIGTATTSTTLYLLAGANNPASASVSSSQAVLATLGVNAVNPYFTLTTGLGL